MHTYDMVHQVLLTTLYLVNWQEIAFDDFDKTINFSIVSSQPATAYYVGVIIHDDFTI